MQVTLIYTKSIAQTVSVIRTYNSLEEAEEKIASLQLSSDAFHTQILVDYANVQFYKEKYEELFDMFIREPRTANKSL